MKDTVNSIMEGLHITSSKDVGVPLKEPEDEDLETLRERYNKANQGQVFTFYDELDTAAKAALYEQLSSFDPDHINEISQKALNPPKVSDAEAESTRLMPLPESAVASIIDSKAEDLGLWHALGLDLVADGKIAVVLMAGGQGTRLGSSAPKGCFNIGLPSEKSLFQIQAERIYKIQKLAGEKHGRKDVVVPWYIMTSGPTRAPTEKFFQEHDYFGLSKDDVIVFEQGVLPCVSNDGKILLESKAKVRFSSLGARTPVLTWACRYP